MRITESEYEFRKKRMIHTAYNLFCKHGIEHVSIAQIAKTAGVSSNSIFRYFDSKAVLVQCTQLILWDEMVRHILADSENQLANAENGFAEMKILLSNFRRLYTDHGQFILFVGDFKLFLVRNHIKMTKQAHDAMIRPVYDTFIAALERGQADGSITREHSPSDQFGALWGVMYGFVEEVVLYDHMHEGENPWKGQFDLVLYYSLKSLTTGSG